MKWTARRFEIGAMHLHTVRTSTAMHRLSMALRFAATRTEDEMDIPNEIRETAEMVANTLADSIIFYNEDGLGAIVMQFDAGGAYVVDINEHGSTQSGMITELSTGFDA